MLELGRKVLCYVSPDCIMLVGEAVIFWKKYNAIHLSINIY